MEYLSPKLLEAFEFASVAHRDQLRKNPGEIPYVSHVAAVALILAKAGYPEDVVVAGLLHDVIEDTKYTAEDIKDRFGERILEIVLGVTENKKLPWDERQQDYNNHLREQNEPVRVVSAADLLANRLSLLAEFEKGNNPWAQMSRNPKQYAEKRLRFDAERISIIKQKVVHEFIHELEQVQQQVVEFTNKIEWG
jgi:(p)ppGpp synthase/HD superfamily hydrolase